MSIYKRIFFLFGLIDSVWATLHVGIGPSNRGFFLTHSYFLPGVPITASIPLSSYLLILRALFSPMLIRAGAQWFEIEWNGRIRFIEVNLFPMSSGATVWASERARMSAVERAREASSAERANEWAVQVNERADKRIAQNSMCRFHSH